MPKIFVTGATGFIGTHLVKQLAKAGHKVLGLSRRPLIEKEGISWVVGEMSDPASFLSEVSDFAPDAVYHLGWEGIPDFSEEMCRKNTEASIRLIDELAGLGSVRKIVTAGSCWEYTGHVGQCGEELETKPHNAFTQAKQDVRVHLEAVCGQGDMDWYWARIFFVYGPGQREGSLIPSLIDRFQKGQAPDIRSPYAKNDFIFIEDLVGGLSCFLKDGVPSGVYNFGSGEETAVHEVSGAVEMAIHANTTMTDDLLSTCPPPKGESDSFYADISKSLSQLGWKAEIRIEDGIREIVRGISA